MASIELRGTSYRIIFRFRGSKISRSLRTKDRRTAMASLARLEDNLRRSELGTLTLPGDCDVADFLLSDGSVSAKRHKTTFVTLSELFKKFFDSLPEGSLEENTLGMLHIHERHILRLMGKNSKLPSIRFMTLQSYVEKRSREPGQRGRTVSPKTIKKEISTLNTVWKWAGESDSSLEPLPTESLRYPKLDEKPPFQTWDEIEQRVSRGGLSEAEVSDLWDCLFLSLPEIDELLEHVRDTGRHPFILPMIATAAFTGARRSELMRSQVEDVDFANGMFTVREKKRVKGKRTTRRVPMSAQLSEMLLKWMAQHPGGSSTFCLEAGIGRSRSKRTRPSAITPDESVDHFRRTFAGSRWSVVHGWHVFRHSFCSNCAAAGIDQRLINDWVGHQTEDMVRRYRHLFPNQQHAAIQRVFA